MTEYIAAIIMLPVIFGLFGLIGVATLSEEHNILKIFLFLLSLLMVINSLWLGSMFLAEINSAYNTAEISGGIGTTTYIMGAIIFIIFIYFLIYSFVKIIHHIAQKKEEELRY